MQREQSKSTAALWMSGWLALMLVMVVAGREVMRELSAFQLMELRSSLGFCFLLPVILMNGGLSIVKTKRLPWHAARNLTHYCAQLGWFYALTLIPIGEVVTIEFTMVIWAAILAAMFLGEQMTASKIAAIVLGLIGVVTIIRPAAGEINPGQMIALVAAVGFGISIALVKSLTRTENTLAIIFWMLVVQSIAGLVPDLDDMDLAVAAHLGLGRRDRGLRHFFALLHGARDGLRRRHRGDADGLPAGSPDRDRGLADLWRAARRLHGSGGGVDPGREFREPARVNAGSRTRRYMNRRPIPHRLLHFSEGTG